MKATIHIKTGTYEFVEVQDDYESVLDIQKAEGNLRSMFDDRPQEPQEGMFDEEGHDIKNWKRVRNLYVNTGEISIEDNEIAFKNSYQRFFINEIKKIIKDNKKI